MPSRRHMRGAAPRLGDDLARDQKTKLDANSREPDPFATSLRACRNVVISRQFLPLHAAPVIDDRQRCVGRIGEAADACRARIESVGDHLDEDRLLERAGVSVPQVFEQMLEVDPCFSHTGILSRGRDRSRGRRR